MENIYLRYYTNDTKLNDDLDLFFEYQCIIKSDLRKIKIVIEDYKDSKEKDEITSILNNIIDDLGNNKFEKDPAMELNICVRDNYLIFSYYPEESIPVASIVKVSPSIVIITRDIKKIYLIDEENDVHREDLEYETLNLSHDIVRRYTLENKSISKSRCEMTEYTTTLFKDCFAETDIMVKKLDSML